MERESAVAGRFYPAEPDRLASEVRRLLGDSPAEQPVRALGVVAPHAGYIYSGAIAGATFARVQVPRRVVVLCPNHTGLGHPVALWPDGAFETPVGRAVIDPDLATALAECPLVAADRAAHRHEHALEVQLPFLLARQPDLRIAPLCLGPLTLEQCRELGAAIAAAAGPDALVVASSDMSHYISAAEARRLDHLALDRVLALDPEGLYETVRAEDITMCGVIPATVMLFAVRQLGAREATLVRYGNSGEVTGDARSVVGYAGVIVS
jgi:hypothetical protein